MKNNEIKIVGRQIFEENMLKGFAEIVVDVNEVLDDIDTFRLKKITDLFINSSWGQREIMYNLLIK